MKSRLFFGLMLLAGIFSLFQNCSGVKFEKVELNSAGKKSSVVPVCREVDALEVQPKLKWDWYSQLDLTAPESHAGFSQVMATPMVADLNNDGTPEVVFISFSIDSSLWFGDTIGSSYNANGVLRIVDGRTGINLKSIASPDLAPFGSNSPLLVDLDADGKMEIIYTHYTGRKIIALNHNGSFRWEYQLNKLLLVYSGLAAADFNNDGRAEVVLSDQVIHENSSGLPVKFFDLEGSPSSGYQFAYGLNPSMPHEIQILGQNGVFNDSGTKLFSLNPSLRYAAADLYLSQPGIEIVGSGSGLLQVFSGLTGEVLVDIDLKPLNDHLCPAGNVGGGPPTIGDFDGDTSTIEIAVATGRFLTVFSDQGAILAKYKTQDCSSLSTGISSFDFNGDGKPEILYADEEYFRIFEIHNAELRVIYKTPNPTGTLLEYPVVVDVDGNGSSEIIVASNNYPVEGFYRDPGEEDDKDIAGRTTGVRAFESFVANSWMPTRKIWNQFDYNPQMVSEAGRATSLAAEGESYVSRTFRRNSQLGLHELKCE